MPVLPILLIGNPLLRKRSKEIKATEDMAGLITDMFDTLYDARGIGLAAVQVGHPIRLFIINVDQDTENGVKGTEEVFINPKLLKTYGKDVDIEEGCLCIPDIREKVRRKDTVDIEYTDHHGQRITETGVTGMRARALQHEYDHLDGLLFVDRLTPAKKLLLKKELEQIAEDSA